jgi:nucleotide-binding universal stress UspA family protein
MSRVLLPLAVLENETVDAGLVELLANDEVVLLGYHQIPEQTAPEQAQESFEERATAKLEDIEGALTEAGADVDRRLVFTHDPEQTRTRVAADEDCDAVVTPGSAMEMDRLLVVVHPAADAETIASFVAEQVTDTDRSVVLLSLTPEEDVARESLDTARTILGDAWVTDDQVSVHERVTDDQLDAIVEAATDCDAVVMGERRPSAISFLLGEFVDRVQTETVGPVIVVRTEPKSDDATGDDAA